MARDAGVAGRGDQAAEPRALGKLPRERVLTAAAANPAKDEGAPSGAPSRSWNEECFLKPKR